LVGLTLIPIQILLAYFREEQSMESYTHLDW